ncbi:unnamed protein product [Ectocarpus fasciculatus]
MCKRCRGYVGFVAPPVTLRVSTVKKNGREIEGTGENYHHYNNSGVVVGFTWGSRESLVAIFEGRGYRGLGMEHFPSEASFPCHVHVQHANEANGRWSYRIVSCSFCVVRCTHTAHTAAACE